MTNTDGDSGTPAFGDAPTLRFETTHAIKHGNQLRWDLFLKQGIDQCTVFDFVERLSQIQLSTKT